jgi:hypothetical protein
MLFSMLRFMSPRNLLPKRTLGWQLATIIIVKIAVLLVIWALLIKDHKVQGHTEALAEYFLTSGATPQKQIIPRSPWE